MNYNLFTHLPNFFIQIKIQMAAEIPTSVKPSTDFHSPVGALISAKVWPNEALYSAFFSSMVNLRQSPFSFSLRTYAIQMKLNIPERMQIRGPQQDFFTLRSGVTSL